MFAHEQSRATKDGRVADDPAFTDLAPPYFELRLDQGDNDST